MRMKVQSNGIVRRTPWIVAALLCLCHLLAPISTAPALAGAGESSRHWSDSFDSTGGISVFSGTKVSGGDLQLSESPLEDLGEAVPGESAVYSLVTTGFGSGNVYCGTGDKGHLVERNPAEYYQEGYLGVPHWGVSNSRGQAVYDTDPAQQRVTALVDASGFLYGGTYPDGYLFRFDPSDPGMPSRNLGACPEAEGAVRSLVYEDPLLYAGTAGGHLFSYNTADDTFALLGVLPGGAPVNALVTAGGLLYIGAGDGHLYQYDPLSPGINDLGQAGGAPVNTIATGGTELYLGAGTPGGSDGRLYGYDPGTPGSIEDLGAPPDSDAAVLSLAADDGVLYAGTHAGRVYRYTGTWGSGSFLGIPVFPDARQGPVAQPVNALSVAADGTLYGGTGSDSEGSTGRLFRVARYEDYGTVPGGGSVTGAVIAGGRLCVSTSGGELLALAGAGAHGAGDFSFLGSPPGGSAVNCIDSSFSSIFAGMDDGRLWAFDDGTFSLVEGPDPTEPVTSVLYAGSALYSGFKDGRVFKCFLEPGTPPELIDAIDGEPEITELVWMAEEGGNGSLLVGASDGRLRLYRDGSLEGTYIAEENSLNAISFFDGVLHAAYASGKVYSFDGFGFEELFDCGSSVESMETGPQGVTCGTASGRLFYFDSRYGSGLHDAGEVPGSGAVSVLYLSNDHVLGGSSGGRLFSSASGYLGDLGWQVERQIQVFSMEYDESTGRAYAGTYRNGHFLVIDPVAGTVIDRGRPVNGEREIECILATSDGTVYGATYGGTMDLHNPEGGRLFDYDPATGRFEDLGRSPDSANWWISSLAECDGVLYGATCNTVVDEEHEQGRFFSYHPGRDPGERFEDLGVPVDGKGTVTLAGDDEVIFGSTWMPNELNRSSTLYAYVPGSDFVTLGQAPPLPGEPPVRNDVSTIFLMNGTAYCGQRNGAIFTFDALARGPEEYDPQLLGRPAPHCESIFDLALGPDGTLLCGAESSLSSSQRGHVYSFDPAPGMSEFRDIAALGGSHWLEHGRVHCLVRSEGASGVVVGGTSVRLWEDGAVDGARLFRMEAHDSGAERHAVSTLVSPGLSDLGPPVAGHDVVGALCAAPGNDRLVCGGTAGASGGPDAELFMLDQRTGSVTEQWTAVSGHQAVAALGPGPGGFVYGGTANGQDGPDATLFRFDPDQPGTTVDLRPPLPSGTKGIFSVAAAADGKIYFGTGDRELDGAWQNCRLFSYDPTTGEFADRGAVGYGPGRLSALLAGQDGRVYGGTSDAPGQAGEAAQFMSFNPATGTILSSRLFGTELGVNAMALGADGRMYFGTGPAGALYSSAANGTDFRQESSGWPYPGNPVLSLTSAGDSVFGCAGEKGKMFRFTPGEGFTGFGPLTAGNTGVRAAAADDLGRVFFGTAGDGRLVRYDPGARFEWGAVTYTLEKPGGTAAGVDVRNAADDADIATSVESGDTLVTDQPEIRLKARLSTEDRAVTPAVEEWSVEWNTLPGAYAVDCPRPAGAYRGEEVLIWGSGFGQAGEVRVGGAAAHVTSWSDGFIRATVPGGAQSGEVRVLVDGSESDALEFALLEDPVAQGVNPTSAHVGEVVEITGSNFYDRDGPDDYVAFQGGGATVYQEWSAERIRVEVPGGAQSGDVSVLVNGRESNPLGFTVIQGGWPRPTTTGISPTSRTAGQSAFILTVKGTGFVDGRSKVMWNGKDRATTYVSSTELKASITAADIASAGRKEVTVFNPEPDGGTSNAQTFTVNSAPSPTWYLAEGTSDYGFDTYVTIQNPNNSAATARVTYMTEAGPVPRADVPLPAMSQTVINPRNDLGAADFSTRVECAEGKTIAVDRRMIWTGAGAASPEGHSSVGVTSPADTWYLPEGSASWGFETWLIIQNPNKAEATCEVTYMVENVGPRTVTRKVPAESRRSFNMADDLGDVNIKDASTKVEANVPVIAERAMYRNNRRGGHCSIGATTPANNYYLAEGTTDWGFTTYLCVQNPQNAETAVNVTYLTKGGPVPHRENPIRMPAHSRKTIRVNDYLAKADFSTRVTADRAIIAERAMYWNSGKGEACHDSIGMDSPRTTFYLPDGETYGDTETWTCVQNPNNEAVSVAVTYMTPTGTGNVTFTDTIGANSRQTYDMRERIPQGRAAVMVTSKTAGKKIMVERAMYWNSRGAGTVTIGGHSE